MSLTIEAIRQAIRTAGLAQKPVCLHSSFRSFGPVEGGPGAVIDGFLAEGCTLLLPTFSFTYETSPADDPALRPARNGWSYDREPSEQRPPAPFFTPDSQETSRSNGIIPQTLLQRKGRVRGNHPICSFTALGPLAAQLVEGQRPLHVYAPLEALASLDGCVLLAGVGLTRMTLIHLAEQQAGRNLFRRWYSGPEGETLMAESGSCSSGFDKLESHLAPLITDLQVGDSLWRLLPAAPALAAATAAIRHDPLITHCGRDWCERCNDAVLGGPLL